MQYDDGDWKELRSRVDSVSNAVFLISGGALTLSITVLMSLKQSNINITVHSQDAAASWHMLLGSIGLFLMLKIVLIAQSFARAFITPEKYNPTLKYTNTIIWLVGLSGFISFILGMYWLVELAIAITNA
jgi:hypothetical protein